MRKSLHTVKNGIFLAWLKCKRAEQGLTMRELALRLDMPHSFIGKVEQGERRLDIIELISYCEALEVDPIDCIRMLTKA